MKEPYSRMPTEEVAERNLMDTSSLPEGVAEAAWFITHALPSEVSEQFLLQMAIAATYERTLGVGGPFVEAIGAKEGEGEPYFFQKLSVIETYWRERLNLTPNDTLQNPYEGEIDVSFGEFLRALAALKIENDEARLEPLLFWCKIILSSSQSDQWENQDIFHLLCYKFCIFRAKLSQQVANTKVQDSDTPDMEIFIRLVREELKG